MTSSLRDVFDVVTTHNVAVLVLLLIVTAGIATGITHLQAGGQRDATAAVGDTEVAQKMEYIRANFDTRNQPKGSNTRPAAVYLRADGNALSKSALLDALAFQRDVTANESVATALGGRRVVGIANIVATRVAGDPGAALDEQITALRSVSQSRIDTIVSRTLAEHPAARGLLPEDYEPGTRTAESHRMVFPLETGEPRSQATAVLYERASERDSPEYFTSGEHASTARTSQYLQNTMALIVPAALLVILLVLAFSYRDLVDVIVGFTGVVLSVLWMFGILGWLRIPAGISLIIGPVLIVGLSVDYGLHVFMRYREERGPDEEIREPMARGLSSVAVALGLVTMTAMVGFMSNATTEFTIIKQLAYAVTLGVLSTFVISVTLVPALKVTLDRSLERLGIDRRGQALGKAGMLERLLSSGATLASRAAPVILVLALVVGSAGALAWTDLDRQSVQQGDGEIADWKTELPEPLAWDVSEESTEIEYVNSHYRAANADARTESNVLLEGDVTAPAAIDAIQAAHRAVTRSEIVFERGDSPEIVSPVTLMTRVAAEDQAFARTLTAADTDGDGRPERHVERVYDALYETAPDRASRVIDRQDGEYRALRVIVPVESDATITAQAEGMRAIASAASGHDGISVTAAGSATMQDAELRQTADSILETLIVALVAVTVLLTLVYRFVTGSASLGLVTAMPIALVTALVIGGMWLFAVPLTLLTALLLSLVIGIGVDYNIHISDRFAQERERGRSVQDALAEATAGTGGALLGSTVTSAGAFSALLLHPHPQFKSFGTLVVLAMIASFVVAVFVLPSLITVWAHWTDAESTEKDTLSGPSLSVHPDVWED